MNDNLYKFKILISMKLANEVENCFFNIQIFYIKF